MFKFDFEIDDADNVDTVDPNAQPTSEQNASGSTTATVELEPFAEVPIIQLLDTLPSLISYSPLRIPLASDRRAFTLLRRDLFDARFQLISEGAGDAVGADQVASEEPSTDAQIRRDRKALDFLDAPSDLVPGVYEGGLKTWECSLDLVDYLDGLKDQPGYHGFKGKRVLELGCGTGVPSLYVLHEILSCSPTLTNPPPTTEIHLQDYNGSVLQLVTLPNLLLTWYASPQANEYRGSTNDLEIAPLLDPTMPGELPITPELKVAFLSSLQASNIHIRLFSGSWNSFDPRRILGPDVYDVLLTSETIYRADSLSPLVNLMRAAMLTSNCASTQEDLDSAQSKTDTRDYLCLVAGKVLYFGVGGGVSDFLETLAKMNADFEIVLEHRVGVGRQVMRVCWY